MTEKEALYRWWRRLEGLAVWNREMDRYGFYLAALAGCKRLGGINRPVRDFRPREWCTVVQSRS